MNGKRGLMTFEEEEEEDVERSRSLLSFHNTFLCGHQNGFGDEWMDGLRRTSFYLSNND